MALGPQPIKGDAAMTTRLTHARKIQNAIERVADNWFNGLRNDPVAQQDRAADS
jgi:hypothetical protein